MKWTKNEHHDKQNLQMKLHHIQQHSLLLKQLATMRLKHPTSQWCFSINHNKEGQPQCDQASMNPTAPGNCIGQQQ